MHFLQELSKRIPFPCKRVRDVPLYLNNNCKVNNKNTSINCENDDNNHFDIKKENIECQKGDSVFDDLVIRELCESCTGRQKLRKGLAKIYDDLLKVHELWNKKSRWINQSEIANAFDVEDKALYLEKDIKPLERKRQEYIQILQNILQIMRNKMNNLQNLDNAIQQEQKDVDEVKGNGNNSDDNSSYPLIIPDESNTISGLHEFKSIVSSQFLNTWRKKYFELKSLHDLIESCLQDFI